MNPMLPYQWIASPFLAWTDLILLSTQMFMSSAQAMGYRTSRMLLAGDTPDAREEAQFDALGEDEAAAAVASTQSVAQGLFRWGEQMAAVASRQTLAGVPLGMSPESTSTARQTSRQRNPAEDVPNSAERAKLPATAVRGRTHKPGNAAPMRPAATANGKRLTKRTAGRAGRKSAAHHTR